jgi:hypothetical protein
MRGQAPKRCRRLFVRGHEIVHTLAEEQIAHVVEAGVVY